MLEILFDLNRGILWWTPLVLVSIAGLFYLQREEKWLLLSFVGVSLWAYSTWASWHGAWSFGNRFFVVLFPVFVIGIASLLKAKPRLKPVLIACALYTFVLSLLFLAATPEFLEVINLPGLLGYWFGDGRLLELPIRLFAKLSFVRAILLF